MGSMIPYIAYIDPSWEICNARWTDGKEFKAEKMFDTHIPKHKELASSERYRTKNRKNSDLK